jgi:hypothetical protein
VLLSLLQRGVLQSIQFTSFHRIPCIQVAPVFDQLIGPAQDVYSTKVMNTVLDSESPHLVVINGDLIIEENIFLGNSTHYVDEIVLPLVQRSLPWASTYGNHDSNYNLSRQGIFERDHRYPNSLTGSMVPGNNAGVSNYFLEVYSYYDGADTPFMQALLDTPELMAAFSGHDHGDNWYDSMLISLSLPTKLIILIGASNGKALYRI